MTLQLPIALYIDSNFKNLPQGFLNKSGSVKYYPINQFNEECQKEGVIILATTKGPDYLQKKLAKEIDNLFIIYHFEDSEQIVDWCELSKGIFEYKMPEKWIIQQVTAAITTSHFTSASPDFIEDKVYSSKEKFRKLAEKLPNSLVLLLNQDMRVLDIMGEDIITLSLDQDDLKNKLPYDFLPPVPASTLLFHSKKVLEGNSQHFDTKLFEQDYSITALPIKNNDVINEVMLIAQNITERKSEQLELKENQRYLTKIFQSVPCVIFLLNSKTRNIEFINSKVSDLSGRTPKDMLSEQDGIWSEIHPQDLPRTIQNFKKIAELEDGETNQIEYRIKHKNGHYLWVLSTFTIFERDNEGLPTRFLGYAQDITHRKNTELDIRQNKEYLEKINNLSGNIIFIFNSKALTVRNINSHGENFFGIQNENIYLGKKDFLPSITHPEDFELLTTQIKQLLSNDVTISKSNIRVKDASSNWKWLQVKMQTYRFIPGDEKLAEILLIGTDISQVMRNKKELTQYREFTEALFKLSPGFIYTFDIIKKSITFSNQKIFSRLGYETNDELPQYLDVIHPEDLLNNMELWNELRENPTQELVEYTNRFIDKKGDTHWFLHKDAVFKKNHDDVVEIIGSAIDITQLKTTEEKLQKYLQGLQELNLNTSDTTLSTTKKLKKALLLVNKFFKTDTAIISKITDNEYTVLHHSVRPEVENTLSDGMIFDFQKTFCEITWRNDDVFATHNMAETDHSQHPCFQALPLNTYIGTPIIVNNKKYGTVNCSSGPSRTSVFDEYDIEFMRLLGRWVGFTIELDLDKEELLKSSDSKDRILATVAHDLRNPIQNVQGLGNLLKMINPDRTREELEILDRVQKSCLKALDLISELLEISELEGNPSQIEKQPTNLNEFISEVLESFQTVAMNKKLELKLHPLEKQLSVAIHKPKFSRVVENLLTNAIKFTDENGKIEVKLYEEDQDVIIEIEDNGIGIPSKLQPIIFDKFSGARRSGLRGEKSTGLGMSIVKQIVKIHQGNIWLKSVEGKGSQFFIKLPTLNSN